MTYDARVAAGFDRRWARYNRRSLAILRPWLTTGELGRVLDVGCGTGNLLASLMEWGARMTSYTGADLSPEMLREARRKAEGTNPRAAFVAADAGALPFGAAAFDTVVSASSLHDWPDARAGLAEARRVLRPGGHLLLMDWHRDPPTMRLLNAGMRLARVGYRRMYARAEMADALAAAGFAIQGEARGGAGGPWRLIAFTARVA